MSAPEKETAAPRQQLSLLDSTCIIVGIIIGASIYKSSPFIARTATLAASAIAVLSLTNVLGLQIGKWTQNVLTILKVVGLGAIVLVALTLPAPLDTASAPPPAGQGSLALALILVMFAYGGWSDMSY